MANQIIYKKRFLNKLDKLIAYLKKEWSIKVANEFLDKLVEKMQTIKQNPGIGGITEIENIRSILVTKHNKVYYKIEKNNIFVLNMIDTRRNPKKNPFNKNK